jgi:DNA-binding NarL/FixJ family response regulator
MPRKRPKTEADRAPSQPVTVPHELETFIDGVVLRRIVERYGQADVRAVLDAMAEQARREMIGQRSRDTLDLMKQNVRPAQTALTVIKLPTRASRIEDGVAVILEREPDSWQRRQLVEIADRAKGGMSAAQIAKEVGVSQRTVERRLAELLKTAEVAAEVDALVNAVRKPNTPAESVSAMRTKWRSGC